MKRTHIERQKRDDSVYELLSIPIQEDQELRQRPQYIQQQRLIMYPNLEFNQAQKKGLRKMLILVLQQLLQEINSCSLFTHQYSIGMLRDELLNLRVGF